MVLVGVIDIYANPALEPPPLLPPVKAPKPPLDITCAPRPITSPVRNAMAGLNIGFCAILGATKETTVAARVAAPIPIAAFLNSGLLISGILDLRPLEELLRVVRLRLAIGALRETRLIVFLIVLDTLLLTLRFTVL